MLRQQCVVEFIVGNLKCTECNKEFHNQMWKAQVQIRQKVK